MKTTFLEQNVLIYTKWPDFVPLQGRIVDTVGFKSSTDTMVCLRQDSNKKLVWIPMTEIRMIEQRSYDPTEKNDETA